MAGDLEGEEPAVPGRRSERGEPGGRADWSALVEWTRTFLRGIAAGGGTVTYAGFRAELRDGLGVELSHRGPGDLAALLRAVSLAEEGEGRGLVSAVVVGPSGRPGRGWFGLAAEVGRDVSDPEQAWRDERARLSQASA